MKHKIIIAIDSFKGCLSSAEAGEAAAQGIRTVCPSCETHVLPVADGGEGLLEALINVSGGIEVKCKAHGPLMEERNTCYGLSGDGHTAFIEMARISGLPLVPEAQRNPMLTTTFGTGELIRDALAHGCRHLLIGLGGSATNDAGMGLLQALGYRFLTADGREAGIGGQALSRVARIDDSQVMPEVREASFMAACDVRNPFYGPEGAAYVFAPQKGADPRMVETLDDGLRHFSEIICQYNGVDIARMPGAGAAGGIGGGLYALLHTALRPGIELVLEAAHFANLIQGADLILTGEGKADRQTLMGKVPAGILTEAKCQSIPVALLAGQVENKDVLLQAGFCSVNSINLPDTPTEVAMRPEYARQRLAVTAGSVVSQWFAGS